MNKLKALLLLLIINNNQTLTLNENTKSAIKSLALLSAGLVVGYMLNKYGRNIPNSALVALKPARVYTVSQIQEMKQSMKGYIESARKCSELCEETLIVEDNLKFSKKYALQKCFLDAFLLFIDYQYASHNNEKFKKIYEPYINNIKLFPCRLINKYFILKRNKNGAANKLITIAPNQTKEKLQSFKGLGELWFLLDENERDMIDRLEKEEDDYAKKCEVLRLQIEDMKKAITE